MASPEDWEAYEAWLHEHTCPDHGLVRITDAGEVPSMMHGTDAWMRLSCGGSVTWDPFSGAERVSHPIS